jgi:hypothetical protein
MTSPDFSKLDKGKTTFDISILPETDSQAKGRVVRKAALAAMVDQDGYVPIPDFQGQIHKIKYDSIPEGHCLKLSGRVDPESELAQAMKQFMIDSDPKFREEIEKHTKKREE